MRGFSSSTAGTDDSALAFLAFRRLGSIEGFDHGVRRLDDRGVGLDHRIAGLHDGLVGADNGFACIGQRLGIGVWLFGCAHSVVPSSVGGSTWAAAR